MLRQIWLWLVTTVAVVLAAIGGLAWWREKRRGDRLADEAKELADEAARDSVADADTRADKEVTDASRGTLGDYLRGRRPTRKP